MSKDEADALLKNVMKGIKAGRQEPVRDTSFPLHAQWDSFPFGGNEHYAVACALGTGMDQVCRPVKRSRPFFEALLDAGLIDDKGNASEALKGEVELKKAVRMLTK